MLIFIPALFPELSVTDYWNKKRLKKLFLWSMDYHHDNDSF